MESDLTYNQGTDRLSEGQGSIPCRWTMKQQQTLNHLKMDFFGSGYILRKKETSTRHCELGPATVFAKIFHEWTLENLCYFSVNIR